jgi:hypothetical protein
MAVGDYSVSGADPRGPSINPYPTNDPAFMAALGQGNTSDTSAARALREDVLRNMRWSGGEANLAADTAQGDLSLGQKPYVPKYDDSALNGPEFAPGLGGLLDVYKNAPLAVMQGNKQDTSEMGGLFAIPGNKYRLISDGKLVGEASTPADALALAKQANDISAAGGRKANVVTQMAAPGQDWQTIFNNAPNDTTLGTIAKIGLPIALQFIPGLGQALSLGVTGLGGTMLGAGLTGALGGFGGNLLAGESLDKSLKSGLTSGALSALTAGALQGLGGANSAATTVGGGTTAPGSLGFSLNAPGTVLPTFAAPSLSGLGSAAGGFALSPGEQMIDVVGSRVPSAAANAISGTAGGVANIFGPLETGNMPTTEDQMMQVTGNRYGAPSLGDYLAVPAAAAALPLAVAGGPGVSTYSPPASTDVLKANAENIAPDAEMLVTASPTGASGSLGAALPGLAMTLPAMTAAEAVAGGTGSKPLSNTAKTVGRALTGLSLLNSITGGGSQGTGALGAGAATIGTPSSLSPTFSGQLPAPRGIFAPQSFAPRDMSGVDFKHYGSGPAQSFFENVPRNPAEYKAAMAANAAPIHAAPQDNSVADYIRRMVPGATDAQITAYLQSPAGQQMAQAAPNAMGFAEGGMLAAKGSSKSRASRAVDGPGTGRSDEIPALLSDGEYVIDAETVAMLGDGSSKAGAKRLDDFRVNVRKHKGRNLAKGEFSANAKPPEKYLSGGRV